MLEELEYNQLLTVAMVSYVYSHADPMSLLTHEAHSKEVSYKLLLWVNTSNGKVYCNQRKSSLLRVKGKMLKLPDTEIPIKKMAIGQNLNLPAGRRQLVLSVFSHIIHYWWSASSDFEKIGLTKESVSLIRDNLHKTKCMNSEISQGVMILNKIIMPVLLAPAGENKPTVLH